MSRLQALGWRLEGGGWRLEAWRSVGLSGFLEPNADPKKRFSIKKWSSVLGIGANVEDSGWPLELK